MVMYMRVCEQTVNGIYLINVDEHTYVLFSIYCYILLLQLT